MLVHMIYWFTI